MSKTTTCSIEGCDNVVRARSWCNKHWKRWRKHGDPQHAVKSYFRDPEASFLARTEQDGTCLVWTGGRISAGYGLMAKRKLAHRHAWERVNGPIPEGMVIDHTCHRKSCVNVDHLRLATRAQNGSHLSGAHSNSKTGVRNVHLTKSGTYQVQVNLGGVAFGGRHSSLADAAREAEQLRREIYGDYAGLG